MEINKNNKDLVQKLKELNAMIATHIEKVKKDVQQLNSVLTEKRSFTAKMFPSNIPGIHETARQWHQHLN